VEKLKSLRATRSTKSNEACFYFLICSKVTPKDNFLSPILEPYQSGNHNGQIDFKEFEKTLESTADMVSLYGGYG